MKLEELRIYNLAMELGEQIYVNVIKWDELSRNTIGSQVIRSVDSIAANIAEGYGRYHYKDSNRFNFIARGSLFETKTWVQKANKRGLIGDDEKKHIEKLIQDLSVKLNNYINSSRKYQN